MKKIILFVCVFFVGFHSSSAQIVLTPPNASGGVVKRAYFFSIHWNSYTSCYCDVIPGSEIASDYVTNQYTAVDLKVYDTYFCMLPCHTGITITCSSGAPCGPYCYRLGWGYTYCRLVSQQSILEFDISSLIGLGVTADNFQQAELGNLQITDAGNPGGSMTVYLHNLHDTSEDGVISVDDYSNFITPEITTLFMVAPPIGTSLNNIDVTGAIYDDLFGSGNNEDFSGFVLVTPLCVYEPWSWVEFEPTLPSLTITIDQTQVPSLTLFGLLLLITFFSVIAIMRLR